MVHDRDALRCAVALFISISSGCSGAVLPPGECGPASDFDTDGDGISDRVEQNNDENNYADVRIGRCDGDPSRAVGSPNDGQLRGGLNLPDRGTGYLHYRGTDGVDEDDWGTLTTVNCLEAVGRVVSDRGIQLGIGDISRRFGGPFPPHASHQTGLDVDLRYVRFDRQHRPLDLRIEPESYDPGATQAVFEAFFQFCPVDLIFVDLDRIEFGIPGREDQVLHVNGHSNHFHVRVGGSS